MTSPSRRTRHVALIVFGGGLLAGEVWWARSELARAWQAVLSARPVWTMVAVSCTFVSMQCFARAQRSMLRTVTRGTSQDRVLLIRVVRLSYSANALSTTLPAGGPISIIFMLRRLRSWGLPWGRAGFAVVASGVLSTVTFAGLVVACGLATGRADAIVAVSLTVTVTLAVVGWAGRYPGLSPSVVVAGLVRRLGTPLASVSSTAAAALREAGEELASIRPRALDWVHAGSLAAGNWLADLGCLAAASQAIPHMRGLTAVGLLAAYIAGMSSSSVAVLPGGFGVVELAMILTLHGTGVPTAAATAAVLLYRLISCVLVVAVGWAALAVDARASMASDPRGRGVAQSEPERSSAGLVDHPAAGATVRRGTNRATIGV